MGLIFIAVIVIFFFILLPIIFYNTLIGKKNQVDNVFGSIDALLKKRYDLIPNLVATAQTYMKYEEQVLKEVTEMRTKAMSGNMTPDEKVDMDSKMSKALGNIMVAVEKYPDLKANQNFLQLQSTLTEIEEQISAARRAYNASVTDYNNTCQMFPTNIMAGMMGYKPKKVFETAEAERQNVNVKDLFNK
jgi:LemA protein